MPEGHTGEMDAEEEFFSQYAHIYAEPEVVWLERIIAQTGHPLSPNVIAHAVLRAGYVRSRTRVSQSASTRHGG